MWEQVKRNRRKTLFFWLLTGIVFFIGGYALTFFVGPFLEYRFGITRYSIIFLLIVFWLILSLGSYFFGDSILIKISEARKVDREVNPRLFNIVEEMKLASGLEEMPDIYIIPSLVSNAFATGVRMENSSIIVTAGLLSKLNREELQAVVAHEVAHIANRDIVLQTFLGALWGSFTIVALLLFIVMFGGRLGFSRMGFSRNRQKGFSTLAIILMLMKMGGSLLSSVLSRTREYLADATAVRLTRNPGALASALHKIDIEANKLEVANAITAPMYIEAPLKQESMVSTHPPIENRKTILAEMTYGAHYQEYQRAYNKVLGKSKRIIPGTVLVKDKKVSIKKQTAVKDIKQQSSHGTNSRAKSTEKNSFEGEKFNSEAGLGELKKKYKFFNCRCGLKIKIEVDFDREKFSCPNCGRIYNASGKGYKNFNTRHFKAINFMKEIDELQERETNKLQKDEDGNYFYPMKNLDQWESFLCECGGVVQLPPRFNNSFIKCRKCGSKITIKIRDKENNILERIKINENRLAYMFKADSLQRYLCMCGAVIKLTSDFKKQFYRCEQCQRRIKVKSRKEVEEKNQKQETKKLKQQDNFKQQHGQEDDSDIEKRGKHWYYSRKDDGWEMFSCVCENDIELSPVFSADSIKCKQCGRQIGIES